MRIDSYKVLFWDFDGVIKESLDVKTEAFVKLFEEYGAEITERVRTHHLENGGMSRFDKFPIYARWAGKDLSKEQVEEFSGRFSSLAFQGVLNSDWVPGVQEYLRRNRHNQIFILVSATPHEELLSLLDSLYLADCFYSVFGSPLSKYNAIAKSLVDLSIPTTDCLMIGDARADMEAAKANGIDFLLRRHHSNNMLFASYKGPSIRDFIGL